MDHLYHIIGENERGDIEWNYDNEPKEANRAWAHITETGRAPDESCALRKAMFWKDGKLVKRWQASAEIIPFRPRSAVA